MAKGYKRKKSGAVRALQAIFTILILGCAGLAGYLFLAQPGEAADDFEETQTFAEGVYVQDVPLAGMSVESARYALAAAETEMVRDIQFQLDTPTKSLTLTYADFTITFDTGSVLEQAILLGNSGTRREREEERERLLEAPQYFTITYTVDVSPAEGKIRDLALALNTEPVNASVEMDMSVDGWFRYMEGSQGRVLQEDALLEEIERRANEFPFRAGPVELPVEMQDPEVTIEQLQSQLTLRARAETSFRKSPYNREDRVFNVKKAAGFLNGFVLKPGEEFSTNDTFGPRTYELGWKPAPAYVNGTTEDQAGGGVCQVSSTLYNAVVKADLEITYRRNHSSTVSYVPYGLDATINTGTIDFTFRNNTGADIYIFSYTIDKADAPVPEGKEDKTIHVEIFGEAFPEEYDEIRLTAEKVETLQPSGELEIVVDNTQAWDYQLEEVKRRNGAVYQSYKHYYKDGVEIKVEELAKSTYKAFAGRIIVGPGYYSQQGAVPPAQ